MGFHHEDGSDPEFHARHGVAEGAEEGVAPIGTGARDLGEVEEAAEHFAVPLFLDDEVSGGFDEVRVANRLGVAFGGGEEVRAVRRFPELPTAEGSRDFCEFRGGDVCAEFPWDGALEGGVSFEVGDPFRRGSQGGLCGDAGWSLRFGGGDGGHGGSFGFVANVDRSGEEMMNGG